MMRRHEPQGKYVADGHDDEQNPRSLEVGDMVNLLLGDYDTMAIIPFASWPCRLVAVAMMEGEKDKNLGSYVWRRAISTKNVVGEYTLSIDCLAGDPLPDRFAVAVFSSLVSRVVCEPQGGTATGGDRMWFPTLVADLGLNADSISDCKRVSHAIMQLLGVSLAATNSIFRRRDVRKNEPLGRTHMTGLFSSCEYVLDSKFVLFPTKLEWNQTAYHGIVAAPRGT